MVDGGLRSIIMPDENNELVAFVLCRGQVKAQLTHFQTFLNDPKFKVQSFNTVEIKGRENS